MKSSPIILATRNGGKIAELAELLGPFQVDVIGLDDRPDLPEVEETGSTFVENALLKAETVSKLTGLIAIADDSGLEVDALGGRPGVYSARYSQKAGMEATDATNIQKLLEEMRGLPEAGRTARFCCAMAACDPQGRHIVAEGTWEGRITEAPSGSRGFGYDPVFFVPECACTAANLSQEIKNSLSHRAKAAKALLGMWPEFFTQYGQGIPA